MSLFVQKLRALGEMKPVPALLMACAPVASARKSWTFFGSVVSAPNWYCLRLPAQRTSPFGSGRNMPMKTWLLYVPCELTLTGRLAEANTLLIACTSFRICMMA